MRHQQQQQMVDLQNQWQWSCQAGAVEQLGFGTAATSPPQLYYSSTVDCGSSLAPHFECAPPPPLPAAAVKTEPAEEQTQLPEQITDFILKYSKDYSSTDEEDARDEPQVASARPEARKVSTPEKYPIDLDVFWDVDGTEDKKSADAEPAPDAASVAAGQQRDDAPKVEAKQSAKQTLRELITKDEIKTAWVWALKCSRAFPGALYYRDRDGDRFTHLS